MFNNRKMERVPGLWLPEVSTYEVRIYRFREYLPHKMPQERTKAASGPGSS